MTGAAAGEPGRPLEMCQVITYTVDGRGRRWRVREVIDDVPIKGWLYADQPRPIAELEDGGAVVSRFV